MTLTAVHLMARFAHLLVYLGIGNVFGANSATDSVLLLQAPLLVIMAVTSGAADMVVMPVMHRADKEGCVAGLPRMLLLWALKWVVPISLTTLLVSLLWLGEARWHVALILLPLPWLSTSSAVFQGMLNARGRYHLAALGPLFGALIAAPLFWLPATAITLAMILVAIELGRFIALGGFVYEQFSPWPSNHAQSTLMHWAIKGSSWQSFGSLCSALNILIHTLFASSLGVGVVTQIDYANRLWNMIPLLFAGPLTLLHARFSNAAASKALVVSHVHQMAFSLLIFSAGVAAAFHFSAERIASLFYGGGEMTSSTIQSLGDILGIYFFCAIPFVPGMVYIKALSSQGRTRVISFVAAASVPLNLFLTFCLVFFMGALGIALTFCVVLTVNTILLGVWVGFDENK